MLLPAGQPCSRPSPGAVLLRDRWRCARLQRQRGGPAPQPHGIYGCAHHISLPAGHSYGSEGWDLPGPAPGASGGMQMLSLASSAHTRILQLATTRARSRSLLGNKASPCSLALLRNRGITWCSSQGRTHLGSGQGWGVCALLPPPLLPCSCPQQHPNPVPASSTCPQAGRGEQAPVQPKLAANTRPSPEKRRDTGTASPGRDRRVQGGCDTLQGRDSDTATRCFHDHLTSPLGLLLFALKPSSRGQAGCMSGLLRWPLRSACKQGRKGARLCSQGEEPFPAAGTAVPSPGSHCEV